MNQQIFLILNQLAHQSIFLDQIIIFLAHVFPYIVILLAAVFLLFHHEVLPSKDPIQEFVKKWREVLSAYTTAIIAWLASRILKIFFSLPRPLDSYPEIDFLLSDTGFAFPSGHATFFMALAVSIFLSHKKAGYWFMFFALLIGTARVIAGVHFPVDILAGFLLGAVIAYFLRSR